MYALINQLLRYSPGGVLHLMIICCICSQTGCFVPASSVTLGVVDRLFARVGASDNVSKHMSTFHMEMSETANILSNATANSFVVLDEIGMLFVLCLWGHGCTWQE